MGKRFTDDCKWDKQWFRKLSPTEKCFWNYICDHCHYGFWEVDFETASYFIGTEVNEIEIREKFKKQYIELNEGKIWLLVDYCDFQYGEISEDCKPHKPIIEKIKKIFFSNTENDDFILWMNRVLKGYTKGIKTLEEKDKEKDKDNKGGVGEKEFQQVWDKYPSKDGRKDALRHFLATVKTPKDLIDINSALENYLRSEKVKKNFIKNGSTWFNNWRDWIEYKPPNEQKNDDRIQWKQFSKKDCSNCRGEGAIYAPGTGQYGRCGCYK